jgi:hypothetical protein
MIHRLSEYRDESGHLTHKMCCVCFTMTPVEDLWVDDSGQRWDLCSEECAGELGLGGL